MSDRPPQSLSESLGHKNAEVAKCVINLTPSLDTSIRVAHALLTIGTSSPTNQPCQSNDSLIPTIPPGNLRSTFQIDVLHTPPPFRALADQIPEILPRDLAFALHLQGLCSLLRQLDDALLKTGPEVFGGEAQDLADFGGDAEGVGVCVFDLVEGGAEFGSEAGAESCGDGVEDVS